MIRAGKPAAKRSKHTLHWLEYALLQQGRFDEAKATVKMMKQDLEAAPGLNQEQHYVYMRGSWVCEIPLIDAQMPALETGELPLGESSASRFTSGFGFMARGQVEQARAELAQMVKDIEEAKVLTVEQGLHEDDNATSEDDYLLATIMSRSLKSLLLFQDGETEAAVSLLKSAVEDENARPPYYGPPHVPKPSGELLGEMLLVLNRPSEAVIEFETALLQHTGRTRTLLGLTRAAEAAGDDLLSARARHQIEANWKGDLDALMQSGYPWLRRKAE
jgi:tetratricopeptide (TPR) repeat protein